MHVAEKTPMTDGEGYWPFTVSTEVSKLVSVAAWVCALALALSHAAQAQAFTVLHTLSGGGDGADPLAGLTLDRAGNLYGTAYAGGINAPAGTVFKLVHAGSGWLLNPLYEFSGAGGDGANPAAGVLFGPDGSLYGTTFNGGSGFGTVYKLQPPLSACKTAFCYWTETVLYRFASAPDGHQPAGNVSFDQAGNIYGTTEAGGSAGYGTVFKLTRSGSHWTEQVLYSFMGGQDGTTPSDGVVIDRAGNLYGTTPYGGIDACQGGCGTVFELTPSGSGWTEQVLYRFQGSPDGQRPYAGLLLDPSGNLFGATYEGGNAGGGTIFELSRAGGSWNYSVLFNLSGSENGPYASLTRDSAGNLYDTTIIPSTIFKLSPSGGGWSYTDLHDFSGNDGIYPRGSVTLDSQGSLYGTASMGGGDAQGTIWEFAP